MKIKQVVLPTMKASYFEVAGWALYHLVRPVLQVVTNPLCNWIESKHCLLYIRRPSLKIARLWLDNGGDPSNNKAVLLFSSIQSGVWNLGWTYRLRYLQQHIRDLMAAGLLDEALSCACKSGAGQPWEHPWEKRIAAEILALQAGYPLPSIIEPPEGPIYWSIQKILSEELPKWKKEDIDYIIAELYLRWGYRTTPAGLKRAIKPGIWDRVMGEIRNRFPQARTLRWYNSCACQTFDYCHLKLESEEELELETACKGKASL